MLKDGNLPKYTYIPFQTTKQRSKLTKTCEIRTNFTSLQRCQWQVHVEWLLYWYSPVFGASHPSVLSARTLASAASIRWWSLEFPYLALPDNKRNNQQPSSGWKIATHCLTTRQLVHEITRSGSPGRMYLWSHTRLRHGHWPARTLTWGSRDVLGYRSAVTWRTSHSRITWSGGGLAAGSGLSCAPRTLRSNRSNMARASGLTAIGIGKIADSSSFCGLPGAVDTHKHLRCETDKYIALNKWKRGKKALLVTSRSSHPSFASRNAFPYFPHYPWLTAGHQGTILKEDNDDSDIVLWSSVDSLSHQMFRCCVSVHAKVFYVVHH